jgi:hypothetical protein
VAALLIILIGFNQFYGQEYEPPVIINGDFRYWTLAPEGGETRPYYWLVDHFGGGNDSTSVFETYHDGRRSMALRVYQDGRRDLFVWAAIHIRQEVTGTALRRLLNSKIGIWLYANLSYRYDETTKEPLNVFGVEINDGRNLLWFIFSDGPGMAYNLRSHRIVVVPTPLHEWSYREIDINAEYAKISAKQPESLSFILILGSTWGQPGLFEGYFASIDVIPKTQKPSPRSSEKDLIGEILLSFTPTASRCRLIYLADRFLAVNRDL